MLAIRCVNVQVLYTLESSAEDDVLAVGLDEDVVQRGVVMPEFVQQDPTRGEIRVRVPVRKVAGEQTLRYELGTVGL